MLSFLIRLCASASAVNPGFPILRDPETVIKNRTDRPSSAYSFPLCFKDFHVLVIPAKSKLNTTF
jgi:hypothetical protein